MELKLPPTLRDKRDILRLLREVETLLEHQVEERVHKESHHTLKPLEPSYRLNQLLTINKLPASKDTYKKLSIELPQLAQRGKRLHVAVASEPSDEVSEKLVGWFRDHIDQQILVEIGVQPMIAGGIVVQTPRRRLDLSLRSKILSAHLSARELLSDGEH